MEKEVILVTGSAGRIGAALCKRLGDKYRIVGFELVKALYASANEELVPMDITSDESVLQAMTHIRNFYGNKIAAVIHLAAYYSFSGAHPELYDKITVEGTRRLLKNLQSFEVGQFIFSSTMLVHKPCPIGQIITEDSPVLAKWDYPKSKVATEKVIHETRGNIPGVIMRISGVYEDWCNSIPIANQIQRLYEHQITARFFAGNMNAGATFLHMDDLVEAIVLSVEKRTELPEETTLLIGEPNTLSYDQLQRLISREIDGKEITTHSVPKFLAKIGSWVQNHTPFMPKPFIKPWMIDLADDNYLLDITRARTLLGWEPKRSIQETLPKMIASLKKDPKKFFKENHLI